MGRGLVTRFHHKAANYAALGNNIYTIYKREMTVLKGKYILKIPTILYIIRTALDEGWHTPLLTHMKMHAHLLIYKS